MYLNTVDFGSHSFGIKTASRTFFNTTPDSLKIEEAATLVGVLKAPPGSARSGITKDQLPAGMWF
jgi:penicillin-binding protein 1A